MQFSLDAGRKSRLSLENWFDSVRPLFFGALATGLLLWVARCNGYPTFFSDSGGYLITGRYLIALPPYRAPGYAIFMRWTSLDAGMWRVVVAQALVVVYVLREATVYFAGGDRKSGDRLFLASVCLLAALTSLPWTVSVVMPDVFAGTLFLSAFLLAFASELSVPRRIALAAALGISAFAHASLLPIGLVLIAGLLLARFAGGLSASTPAPRALAAWLLIPLLAAGLFTASLNRRMGLGFRYSASGDNFLLGKLFSDGLAGDYLRAHCPQDHLVSCDYLEDLPRSQEEFLFQHPLSQKLFGHPEEVTQIVRGAIRAHPLKFVAGSLKDSLLQFASLRTGDEIRSYGARDWNAGVIWRLLPEDYPAYSNSRQVRGSLLRAADLAARVDQIVFWLSVLLCVALARAGRFPRLNAFFYFACAFLVFNAAFCATVAGVFDRYQTRVAWLIPFCATAYVWCALRESALGKSETAASVSYEPAEAELEAEA